MLDANPEVPLNTAEILRLPSSEAGKVTVAWAWPEPLTGTAEARSCLVLDW